MAMIERFLDSVDSMVNIVDLEAAEMTADAEKLVTAILKGDPSDVSDVIKDFKAKGKGLETVVKTMLSINDLRDIHTVNESARGLISWIALSGLKTMTPFHLAALVDGRTIVDVFLKETDINVDYRTPESITILHLASFAGYLTLVETLVNSYKADLSLEDDWGRVAIHYAASGGHLAIVKYLTSKRANPIARDKAGRTPLMYAWDKQKYDVVEHLQAADGSSLGDHAPMYGAPPVHTQGGFVRLPFEADIDPVMPPKEVFRSNPIYHENIGTVEANMKAMNVKDNTTKESGSTSDDTSGPASKMLFFERPTDPKDGTNNPAPTDTQTPPWKYYDLPPRKVFTKAELARMKSKAEKRKSEKEKSKNKKKHNLYDELDNFPDYSDQMYAEDEPPYPYVEGYPQPMQQYYDPYYYYDDQAPAYTQTQQRIPQQMPPLFSYQGYEYPEFQREIIHSAPPRPASEPVRVIREPPIIVREQPRIIREPPQIIREPPRVIQEPGRINREQPMVIREPPRVIHEPPRAIHEPPRVIYEQPHIIQEPARRVVSTRPEVIEERRPGEIIRRPTTRVLPDGTVAQLYPIEPPKDGVPTRTVRKIPPPANSEVHLRELRGRPHSYSPSGPILYPPARQSIYHPSSSNYVDRTRYEGPRAY